MSIKPCFQWTGSKTSMAPAIVELMKEHGSYVEPFAGGLSVLLAKPPAAVEVVNDSNELLVTFYRVLREDFDALSRAIMFTPYSRVEFNRAVDDPSLDEIERVRRFFVRVNQAYVSSNGTGNWTCTVGSSSQHSNASKWTRFQERLWAVRSRLDGVQLECCDAFTLLEKYTVRPDLRCVAYIDPPYLVRNGAKYQHDMTTPEEHERLAEICNRMASNGAQVIVSGYAMPEYDHWYAGWHRIEMSGRKTGQPGSGSRKQVEVLWVSDMVNLPHPSIKVEEIESIEDPSEPAIVL